VGLVLRSGLLTYTLLAAAVAAVSSGGCATGEASGEIDAGEADAATYEVDAADEGCPCDYLGDTDGVCAGGGTRDSNGNCTIAPPTWQATESTCDWNDNDCDGRDDEGCLPNDECSDAIVLNTDTGQGTYTFDYATQTVSDCASGREMWFRFTIAEDRLVYFDTFGSTFDTRISLRSSCAGSYVGCEDDDCSALQERLVTQLSAGTYYVAVHAFSASTLTGTVTFRWQLMRLPNGGYSNCLQR